MRIHLDWRQWLGHSIQDQNINKSSPIRQRHTMFINIHFLFPFFLIPLNHPHIAWNYDGSSTGQADGHYSEIWLSPIKYVLDPFRGGDNILCLCETLDAKTMKPIETNKRVGANNVFSSKAVFEERPWFGIEQEYTLMTSDGRTPLGWPTNGFPAPQGPYYCGVGTNFAHGRHIAESHYRACLYAGLDIAGINAEVMPGQWVCAMIIVVVILVFGSFCCCVLCCVVYACVVGSVAGGTMGSAGMGGGSGMMMMAAI